MSGKDDPIFEEVVAAALCLARVTRDAEKAVGPCNKVTVAAREVIAALPADVRRAVTARAAKRAARVLGEADDD